MPESVTDRCTKAHEYVFLLSKSERYFFDSEAMREPVAKFERSGEKAGGKRNSSNDYKESHGDLHRGFAGFVRGETRNRRSVWTVAPRPYKGAHFATFPIELIEPAILAGSKAGDIVLDPFMGSGTTALACEQLGRKWVGCEINPEYKALQDERLKAAV
jgi:DNA modification methylase